MLKKFWNWLWVDNDRCMNCEFLRDLLEQERRNNKSLLDSLLAINQPSEPRTEVEQKEFKPITSHVPFRVRQQMLEQEDRVKAAILKDKAEENLTEELESKLGIENAS